MADGVFLIGTDRGVGKTLVGVGLVALLRERGVDATLMTPLSTGGSVEHASEMLARIGVHEPKRLVNPVVYETLASPYVASMVERRPVDVPHILQAYRELRGAGRFVVVEGGGVMVPISRRFYMVDLLKAFELPSLIIARTGRGTLNHCVMTLRMMQVTGETPLGFLLNGFGQYGEGFAESVNPDALRELAAPVPVLGTIEWRPEYPRDLHSFVQALRRQPDLVALLERLAT